jgi:hypothetical protein
MEKLKTYGLALALCGSFAQVAVADTELDVGFNKTHYFTGPFTSRFAGGDLDVELRDGSFIYQLCFGQGGSPFPQGIDPIYCPLGSTGFIAAGDVNNDGVQDSLTYWSIVGPIPAAIIEPFRPDEAALIARPSRELPLLQNFKDISTILYYNLMDPGTFSQYNISKYSVIRNYAGAPDTQLAGRGALTQMNQELVPGQYVFQFPRLKQSPDQVDSVLPLGLNMTPTVEALDPTARYSTGFRFTSGTWDGEFYEMDPRTTSVIKWVGNTRDVIRSFDQFYFAIYDAAGVNIQYPSPFYPDQYLLLSTPAVTAYTMPPLFFAAGQEAELRLEYRRFAQTTSITVDNSVRRFRAKLRMVDSFKGFSALNFPTGSSAVKTKATADFDGDGVNNITEFAAEYPTLAQVALEANVENALFVPIVDENPFDPHTRKVVGLDYSAENAPGLNLPPVQNPINLVKALDITTKIDSDGYAVCLVGKRPFAGTSLIPTFSVRVPSSSSVPRFKKVVPGVGKDWQLTEVPGDPVETPITAYTAVTHVLTGVVDAPALQTFTVTLTKNYWQLKSAQPVADPTAPPPEFQVTVTDVPLK